VPDGEEPRVSVDEVEGNSQDDVDHHEVDDPENVIVHEPVELEIKTTA
jgi:hypothetical protein